MKGKTKSKKLIKVLILAVCFILTIVVSASVTLAWFYDSDWASDGVTMAGAVGIEMRNASDIPTSGVGALQFQISTDYAYPGQAMKIEASVFNNGGSSIINSLGGGTNSQHKWNADGTHNGLNYTDDQIKEEGDDDVGSPCYIRARFVILSNIAEDFGPAPSDTGSVEYEEWLDSQQFNSAEIYEALKALITRRNNSNNSSSDTTAYDWVYYKNPVQKMKFDGSDRDVKDYFSATQSAGYFYLCENTKSGETVKTLKALKVGHDAAFLFNDTFVIPWTLTNITADKDIYIGVVFEAVQTFIPIVEGDATNGWTIKSDVMNNQLDDVPGTAGVYEHFYDSTAVQIVFNTSRFSKIKFDINKDGTYTAGTDYELGGTLPTGYVLISDSGQGTIYPED